MKYIVLLALFISLISCEETSKKNPYTKIDAVQNEADIARQSKQNMENQCYVCHNPKSSKKNRVGPPIAAIKARYMKDAATKEEFVSAIWNFVEKPSKEKAKLKGAVKRFGVMPYQKFNQQEIEAIAAFIYEYQIEEPEWFRTHWKENHSGKQRRNGKKLARLENETQDYTQIGMKYAKSTKAELGKNLMGAMQKEGVIHALEFCNVQAMSITDSMANVNKAKISRVSDKNRNPLNAANSTELNHIETFKYAIQANENISPIVEETEQSVHFYYPIVTNDMCLKCHGKLGSQITQKTYDKILEFYPNDKAIGYDVNEVRGIWSIEFEKDNK
jgi:cytochrome c553